jgi:hypothetical protein
MGRFLFLDLLFFLLPFGLYAVWLLITRGSLTNVDDWQARTITYLALGGALLLLAALGVFITYRVSPPGGHYVPAHMENGKIVPGHIDPN